MSSDHVIKLPDVGEGVTQAELVEWHVRVGDQVHSDKILAAVMTDKATVEIPSPVDGEITWLAAEPGESVAVGAPLVRIKTRQDAAKPELGIQHVPEQRPEPATSASSESIVAPDQRKALASPAVRLQARNANVDLHQVRGSGPDGQILHEDVERFLAGRPSNDVGAAQPDEIKEVKIIGLRRKIAEQMARAHARIPHITIVEEVDVTALEELRSSLNEKPAPARPRLTIIPFLMLAMVKALRDQPQINALYDDEASILRQHAGVHIGIAARTPLGLVVPVVRHAERRDLWDCAAEVVRLAKAAREGGATREELGGSTITISSLGALGAVATTPIINYPEVAIVGVNKIAVRPVWRDSAFAPRKMMNLSSSFDHRIVDGWEAATFVQQLKKLLETPAMLFVDV
jgi:2-oxoisovalerate dehydrogenase E2 component (dihydrolipoyl transacylase)